MRLKGLVFFGALLLVLSLPSYSQYYPYYVLDGYGGVHAGQGAPVITPATPYFGFDIAKQIEFFPVAYSSSIYGEGTLVLDGYGGVHHGGKLASISWANTPYFGFNIARSIVARWFHPQANYSTLSSGNLTVTSTSFVNLRSVYLIFPNDGYALVAAGCSMGNNETAGFVRARVALGVDSTTTSIDNLEWEIGLKKWVTTELDQWRNVNITQMKFVTAGPHTFYFLAKKMSSGDLGIISYYDPTISVIYVDKDAYGFSKDKFEELAGPKGSAIK